MNIISVMIFREYCSFMIVWCTIWITVLFCRHSGSLEVVICLLPRANRMVAAQPHNQGLSDDSTRTSRPFPLFLLWTESSKPSYTFGQRTDVRSRYNFLLILIFISLIMLHISSFETKTMSSLEFRYYAYFFRLSILIILIILVMSVATETGL